jgi:cell division GTPase FtsZ
MGTKTETQNVEGQKLVDDTGDTDATNVDNDKLAALKARMADKKGDDVPPRIVEEKTRSIRMGVVGSGQAGSRLGEVFYKLGYPTVVMNTAAQDLEGIDIPDANKILLDHGLGGAAKDLDIGAGAAEAYRDRINQIVHERFADEQMLIFCTSLGGGSGAGSAETVVDILAGMGMPIAVITVLPQASDDALVKSNAVKTLAKFTKMAQGNKIDNLIVVDNAKIEALYSDVGPFNFFPVSNKAIVEPIDVFNTLSSQPSDLKPLDSTEFGKLFTDGQGLTCYGMMRVENYEDETAIAEAILENLDGNLLASGFDVKQARYVGFMLVAPDRVWNKIPSASLNYATAMINDVCDSPLGVFRGIYKEESEDDCVKVYSMFSGLGLPAGRVDQLKAEAAEKMSVAEKKDKSRNFNLKVDDGDENVSAVEAIRKKIQDKKSSFGKLHGRAVVGRRKK